MSGRDGDNVVVTEVKDGVLVVTMNRPRKKNAINNAVYDGITAALERAEGDEDVLVVVLTGAGDYFSSGADLSSGEIPDGSEPSQTRPVGRFMRALLEFPKPVIAAVNGPAVGIAATLLLHCDFIYASSSAFFWTPFSRIAVVPEFCSSVLLEEAVVRSAPASRAAAPALTLAAPAAQGYSTAMEMVLMGRRLSAARAHELGLASELLPPSHVLQYSLERARELVELPLSRRTTAVFKRLMRGRRVKELWAACEEELKVLDGRFRSGETVQAAMEVMQMKARKGKL